MKPAHSANLTLIQGKEFHRMAQLCRCGVRDDGKLVSRFSPGQRRVARLLKHSLLIHDNHVRESTVSRIRELIRTDINYRRNMFSLCFKYGYLDDIAEFRK